MAKDSITSKRIAQRNRLEAAIAEIEADNAESASFETWTLKRVRRAELEEALFLNNFKLQQRRCQLNGRSLVFDSTVRHQRTRPPESMD